METIITLSDGTKVHFIPEMNHEAEVARFDRMYVDVLMEPDGEGGFKMKGIPYKDYIASREACLPFLISKIEVNGAEVPFSKSWLSKMKPRDFRKVDAQVERMINESSLEIEEGKKNS